MKTPVVPVPSRLRVKHRHDLLEIVDSETAFLHWTWQLASDLADHVDHLDMPLYFEVSERDAYREDVVEFEELSINGHAEEHPDERYSVKRLMIESQPVIHLQQGLLCVPIRGMGVGKDEVTLRVRMKLKCVYPKASNGEVLFVDVVHPTEHLVVEIKPKNGGKAVGSATVPEYHSFLAAESLLTHAIDPYDISPTDRNLLRETDDGICWERKNPTYGYRYRIGFRLFN